MGTSVVAMRSRRLVEANPGFEAGVEEHFSDIFTRATPVVAVPDVPISTTAQTRALAAPRLPQEFIPDSPRALQSIAANPGAVSQRDVRSELEDVAAVEFWRATPAYSEPPSLLVSLPPLPEPSRLRLVSAKLLFLALFLPALALLVHTVSLKFGVPWLNMVTLLHMLVEIISQAVRP